MSDLLSEVSAVIKDAYYHARDHGGTMHTAGDDAARALLGRFTLKENTSAPEVIISMEPENAEDILDYDPDEPPYRLNWRCPVCLVDVFQEIDTAVRWNELVLEGAEGDHPDDWFIGVHLGRDADFENDGWQCANMHLVEIPAWLWETVRY